MSFQQLNKDVLQQVAEEFAVEWTKDEPTKAQMIKDLEEEGVTWAMYKTAFPDVEDQPEVEDKDEPVESDGAAAEFSETKKQVLVKMTRGNGTYQVRGYTFTKVHPFLPVDAADADYLVDELGGFKIASPREVEEFYS